MTIREDIRWAYEEMFVVPARRYPAICTTILIGLSIIEGVVILKDDWVMVVYTGILLYLFANGIVAAVHRGGKIDSEEENKL